MRGAGGSGMYSTEFKSMSHGGSLRDWPLLDPAEGTIEFSFLSLLHLPNRRDSMLNCLTFLPHLVGSDSFVSSLSSFMIHLTAQHHRKKQQIEAANRARRIQAGSCSE